MEETVTGILATSYFKSSTQPQHCTLSSLSNAQVSSQPAATATALVMPETVTGTELLVELPLPRSPKIFKPQHRTVLSARTAQVWSSPAAISVPTCFVFVVADTPFAVSKLELAPQAGANRIEPMNRKARCRTDLITPSDAVLLAAFYDFA